MWWPGGEGHTHVWKLGENFKLKFSKLSVRVFCANTAHNFAQIFDKYFHMLISRRPKYLKGTQSFRPLPLLCRLHAPASAFWQMDQRIYCCIIKFRSIKQSKQIVSMPQVSMPHTLPQIIVQHGHRRKEAGATILELGRIPLSSSKRGGTSRGLKFRKWKLILKQTRCKLGQKHIPKTCLLAQSWGTSYPAAHVLVPSPLIPLSCRQADT